MSINSISQMNISSGFSTGSGSNHTEETKRKLLALGIDPSTVSSEAQAKNLIEQIVQIQKAQGIQPKVKSDYSSSDELICKAKKLAEKIGIKTSNTMSLDEILKLISNKIEKEHLDEYRAEAEDLGCEISNYKQSEKSLYASMNYTANLNKMMLGL